MHSLQEMRNESSQDTYWIMVGNIALRWEMDIERHGAFFRCMHLHMFSVELGNCLLSYTRVEAQTSREKGLQRLSSKTMQTLYSADSHDLSTTDQYSDFVIPPVGASTR